MSMHMQIWQHYCELVQDAHAPQLPLHEPFVDLHTFCVQCFHNHTHHTVSLKLTSLGHQIMKIMYECWSIDLPHDWTWCAANILHVNKKMRLPYYWDHKRFYVYHSEIGLEFELVNRDWHAWIRWD